MKRLAVLALTAGVAVAAPVAAADPPVRHAVPAPTGYAPTVPQIPAPYQQREKVTAGPVRTVAYEDRVVEGPRPFSGLGAWFRRSPAEPTDPRPVEVGRRMDLTPAVRQTLPPPPAELEMGTYGPARPAVTSSCGDAGGACVGGHRERSCWAKFTGWLCFRQTPVKLPHIPTQRDAPQYLYGVGRDGPGVGRAGCGPTGCVPPAGGVIGPVISPMTGDVLPPGYRLANPERPGVGTPVQETPTTTYYRPVKGK